MLFVQLINIEIMVFADEQTTVITILITAHLLDSVFDLGLELALNFLYLALKLLL